MPTNVRCHAYFKFSANQITWSKLLIQIHILIDKQGRSRSADFWRSQLKWQTVKIQISWLLKKPTDLDLHCFQSQGISGFSRTKVNSLLYLFYNKFLLLHVDKSRNCWMSSKQWRLWIEAAECGILSGPTLFAQAYMFEYSGLSKKKNLI